ncbi:MAG: HEPN domain-containing protein [Patescibacteria group bacterium]
MIWKKLLEDESLQPKKVSFREVELVLSKSRESLKAADFLLKKEISEPAFKEAYDAMLLAGRAIIFSLGLKPKTIGSHTIVINFCELYFGSEFKDLIEKFRRMKIKRNYLIYGAGLAISSTEADNSIQNAKKFLKVAEEEISKIKKQNKLL